MLGTALAQRPANPAHRDIQACWTAAHASAARSAGGGAIAGHARQSLATRDKPPWPARPSSPVRLRRPLRCWKLVALQATAALVAGGLRSVDVRGELRRAGAEIGLHANTLEISVLRWPTPGQARPTRRPLFRLSAAGTIGAAVLHRRRAGIRCCCRMATRRDVPTGSAPMRRASLHHRCHGRAQGDEDTTRHTRHRDQHYVRLRPARFGLVSESQRPARPRCSFRGHSGARRAVERAPELDVPVLSVVLSASKPRGRRPPASATAAAPPTISGLSELARVLHGARRCCHLLK